jgi:hypothetical protein
MPPANVAEMSLRMLYNLRSHYGATERSGTQMMAVLGQVARVQAPHAACTVTQLKPVISLFSRD